jgi:hypothetical protein
MSEKLKNLQQFVQQAADTAWQANQTDSPHDPNPTGFGQHLEFTLQTRSEELSRLLNEIAGDGISNENYNMEPIDFTKFIRISNRKFNHQEVFVGDKWVVVPNNATINFETRTDRLLGTIRNSFTVTISYNGNTSTYNSSEIYQEYEENQPLIGNELLLVKGKTLNNDRIDWGHIGEEIYGVNNNIVGALNNTRTLYELTPKQVRRKYTYKLSKIAPKIGKPGKVYQGAQKIAKKTKFLGPLANVLTIGTIGYEATTNTWDAHTIVNGGLLVVGVTAAAFGSGVIVTGIAVYGLLDLIFGISEEIDDVFGRDSSLWNEQTLENYPTETLYLFNEAQIDNTYIAPR